MSDPRRVFCLDGLDGYVLLFDIVLMQFVVVLLSNKAKRTWLVTSFHAFVWFFSFECGQKKVFSYLVYSLVLLITRLKGF